MIGNFQIYINHAREWDAIDIYILQVNATQVEAVCTNLKTMQFKKVESPYSKIKPTMQIPNMLAQPFLQAMANALEQRGIRPEGKPVLENELTATKYHLEDMRDLVFKLIKKEE